MDKEIMFSNFKDYLSDEERINSIQIMLFFREISPRKIENDCESGASLTIKLNVIDT